MSEYFPEPKSSRRGGGGGGTIKVELDLYNYATIANLINAAGVDASKVPQKVDLTVLKSKVILYVEKSKDVLSNLSKLKSKVDKLHVGKLENTAVD